MGNIFRAIKKRLSKRQHPQDSNGGLEVVEDSPYYPFSWRSNDDGEYVVVLYAGDEYKHDILESLGMPDNGYIWEALAEKYINEEFPEAREIIELDPESDMFCAYSEDENILRRFVEGFKALCEDDEKMKAFLVNIDKADL